MWVWKSRALNGVGLLALTVGLIAGCSVSREHANKYVAEGTGSINQVSRAIYASARSNPDSNQSAIDPYETEFEEFRRGQTARLAVIEEEIKKTQLQLDLLLQGLSSLALEFLPGGSSISQIVQAIGGRIDTQAGGALEKATEIEEKLQGQIDAINKALVAMKNDRTVDSLKVDQANADLIKTLNNIEDNAEKLNQDQQASLRQELAGQLSDQKALFKDELLKLGRERGLSEEELKIIQDMSEEDVFQKYGLEGGAGILGLLALIRTFGRSRSKEEVDALREKLEGLAQENTKVQTAQALASSKSVFVDEEANQIAEKVASALKINQ